MKLKEDQIELNGVPELGSIINIQAYKYDGTLYRQWNGARVLEVSPFHIVLVLIKTKVAEETNRKWIIREPTLWFFPVEGSFFNASILLRKKEKLYYINLSSPPIFEDNTLKFIDFDLDIKISPKQIFSVVDENEFAINSKEFKYSEELIKLIRKNIKLIRVNFHDKDYIFDDDFLESYINELKDLRLVKESFKIIAKKKH
ncbi:DUF402 domain-containing protein [[Mycoplasma] mobile]|uniref:RNAse G and E associated domain containing protein n=1 Tax=Mycoplasma mobile (strain ATCC 43663 / 163K / NCTC 11711) TaxID=267748 RepID=Q6KHE6_MYCM1|nr:DUF402 domain-containing protein [[Mycoplasma] mobile]AAT27984.1 RNAse G and E associated domain containing protein [Mycoplasma mobile 163K]